MGITYTNTVNHDDRTEHQAGEVGEDILTFN